MSIDLVKKGMVEKAIYIIKNIRFDYYRDNTISEITSYLLQKGKIDDSIKFSFLFSEDWKKIKELMCIGTELSKQGLTERANTLYKDSIEFVDKIFHEGTKEFSLELISIELYKQAKVEEALAIINDISEHNKSSALKEISIELVKQGKLNEALAIIRARKIQWFQMDSYMKISDELFRQGKVKESTFLLDESLKITNFFDEFNRKEALVKIFHEFIKQGNLEKAVYISNKVSNSTKSRLLRFISVEIAKKGKVGEALDIIDDISEDDKSSALQDISIEVSKQGKLEEALSIIHDISEDRKFWALKEISIELVKQKKIEEAELIALQIPYLTIRHDTWENMSVWFIEKKSVIHALECTLIFKSEEAQFFYLKGLSKHVTLKDVSADFISHTLPLMTNNCESIEILLQKYALNQLFLGSLSLNQISRFNNILNLQWAIDLKNELDQLPN
jgi:hypothetical protein